MENTGLYIGAPNGVVLCVDQSTECNKSGRLYHSYQAEAIRFQSMEQVIKLMDNFFDWLGYPFANMEPRKFETKKAANERRDRVRTEDRRKGLEKIMSDETLLRQHGDLGTFIIRVQHRQNSTWQGLVTWSEQNKTVAFRSLLELIKLIEGAIDESGASEE